MHLMLDANYWQQRQDKPGKQGEQLLDPNLRDSRGEGSGSGTCEDAADMAAKQVQGYFTECTLYCVQFSH